MSSIDKSELRRLAEPYKSFPPAVAAVVSAMFDRGARSVLVTFCRSEALRILDVREVVPLDDLVRHREFSAQDAEDPSQRWRLAYLHHSRYSSDFGTCYRMVELDRGEGVNPHQKRTAKRLARALPQLLSPYEAYHTTVVDESGNTHALLKGPPPASMVDGWEIDWPEKLIGFGDGLIIKYGHVRVPVASLLAHAMVDSRTESRLQILTHPWLQGVMEVMVSDQRDQRDIPTPELLALELGEPAASAYGPATDLAHVLLNAGVPEVALDHT